MLKKLMLSYLTARVGSVSMTSGKMSPFVYHVRIQATVAVGGLIDVRVTKRVKKNDGLSYTLDLVG